ncbi:MAG: Uncharacterized protein AWU56_470 [Idiomarina sp. T82-3]|nr:MAG: Uncharacterized protein AWU56_470 [Idiomarina sp. T82-3]
MARTKLRACLRGRNRRLIVACAFGARAVSVVAQDARRTAVGCSMSRWLLSRRMRDLRWVGADVAMVVVAQNARPTVVGADVAMVVVAQNARPTVGGGRCRDGCCRARCATYGGWGPMSRWLMSRRMRDVRRWGADVAMVVVAQDARPTVGGGRCRDG